MTDTNTDYPAASGGEYVEHRIGRKVRYDECWKCGCRVENIEHHDQFHRMIETWILRMPESGTTDESTPQESWPEEKARLEAQGRKEWDTDENTGTCNLCDKPMRLHPVGRLMVADPIYCPRDESIDRDVSPATTTPSEIGVPDDGLTSPSAREVTRSLLEDANRRGLTLTQLLEQITRENDAYLKGWEEAEQNVKAKCEHGLVVHMCRFCNHLRPAVDAGTSLPQPGTGRPGERAAVLEGLHQSKLAIRDAEAFITTPPDVGAEHTGLPEQASIDDLIGHLLFEHKVPHTRYTDDEMWKLHRKLHTSDDESSPGQCGYEEPQTAMDAHPNTCGRVRNHEGEHVSHSGARWAADEPSPDPWFATWSCDTCGRDVSSFHGWCPDCSPNRAFPTDVEELSEILHFVYQTEAKRQGDVRHSDEYGDLPEHTKEYDRVLARYILERETRRSARASGGTSASVDADASEQTGNSVVAEAVPPGHDVGTDGPPNRHLVARALHHMNWRGFSEACFNDVRTMLTNAIAQPELAGSAPPGLSWDEGMKVIIANLPYGQRERSEDIACATAILTRLGYRAGDTEGAGE